MGNRKPLEERLWAKVEKHGGVPEWRPDLGECWVWTGAVTNRGYGQVSAWVGGERKNIYVHRVAWELCRSPIPAGQTIDHLCRNRRCVNPEHLEVVPRSENSARGAFGPRFARRQVLCLRGHPLSGKNLYVSPGGQRHCRACKAARYAAESWSVKRMRAEIRAARKALSASGETIPAAAALIDFASEVARGAFDGLAPTRVVERRAILVGQLLDAVHVMIQAHALAFDLGESVG